MNIQQLSCNEARRIDLEEYLATLGHHPQNVRGADLWYISPFREEKTPSFKVNKTFNIWYDHGIGKGGNLIDFGILYHKCSVSELLRKLNSPSSFQQLSLNKLSGPERIPAAETPSRIKILSDTSIDSPTLIDYLDSRKIPLDLAQKHCRQVDFQLYGRTITSLGFPNRSGGYELRTTNFKSSSSPKDISFVDNGQSQVAVFEGFFSYLSFHAINGNKPPLTNFLVLNSLAFFEKSRSLMEEHEHVHLFLDRDPAGGRFTEKALGWCEKYIDRSVFYSHNKDLNEWLKDTLPEIRQRPRQGRHL